MSDEKELLDKLPELSPLVAGPLMAFVLTVLKALHEKKETSNARVLLEAAICACITVGVMAAVLVAVVALKVPVPEEYAAFIAAGIGSFVATIGFEPLRRFVLRLLDNKLRQL